MGRLSKVALKAISPSTVLRLRLDSRVEADSGRGGRSRARTSGAEPVATTSPRRRSGTPLTRAIQGDLERALDCSLLPPGRPGARPVNSVDGMGYRGRLDSLLRKGDWGGGDAKRSGRERVSRRH